MSRKRVSSYLEFLPQRPVITNGRLDCRIRWAAFSINSGSGNSLRVGFHSIESILSNNPHKIKKVTLPASRNDQRISSLILALEKNSIKYDLSSKLKQEPEAIIVNEYELNFKDLKNFLSSEITNPLILILDNIIDPRNLGACIRSAAVTNVDAVIINKHHCAPLNDVAHSKILLISVTVDGSEVGTETKLVAQLTAL